MAYGPQGQILDATEAQGRNTNSIMAGWVDRGPWQYWDTWQLAAGTQAASQYNMFTIPIGGQNPLAGNASKGKLQTNLQQSSQFQPPRCLLLMQIGLFFGAQPVVSGGVTTWTPMFLDDIAALYNGAYFEFKIDDKTFHEGQIWEYPAAVGLAGTSTQSGQQNWTNGLPIAPTGRRYGDWSKYIAPLQLFQFILYFPGTPPTLDGNGPGAYMPIVLDGLTDRSVQ